MRIKFLLIFILIITGCSVKQPPIGKKVIPNEDEYIVKALVNEENGNYKEAVLIYQFLYEKTKKPIYLEKKVENLFRQKKYNEVIKIAQNCEEKCNYRILEYEIFALINQNKINKAKEILLTKMNEKKEFFYSMMSYILLTEGKYEEALHYLKSLYALNSSKNVLLDLVDVLIKLKKYNEALAYLRTHLNLYGCDFDICNRLANIYKSLYDYDNLANIYEKMGQFDEKYYILALNVYIQNNEYQKAKKLILKYNLDKEYLIFLYSKMKEYRKAAFISLNLYEKTASPKFLLKYCELLYKDHPTKKEIKDIVNKLKFLSTIYPSDYLYNFIGYLLIKFDINPKEGIKFVQKALLKNPDNEEYIDSLAWGYYKLHKCKKAYEIIKYIKIKDKEIEYHKKMIKKCLQNEKYKMKNLK